MKNKLSILTLALLKNSYSLPTDPKKRTRQILVIGALALCFAPMVLNIGNFVAGLYDTLVSIGEEGVLLSLGIAVSALIIFFFGLFYTMNTFYFSDDIESLLPLPVKSSHILGAKFIIVTLFEYLTECLVLVPILVVYGVKSGQGFLYYMYGLFIFLSLPVLPIMLDSIIVMIIMRLTNLAKNKDAFRMISAIIAIVLWIGVNALSQRIAFSQGMGQLRLGNNSLVSITANIFPVSKFGALGLINSETLKGLGYTSLFIAFALVGFLFFLFLGNLLYYQGVTGVSVSSSHGKQISGTELERQAVRSSVLKSYVLKELRILFRTPAYFINCVLTNFIWPLFFVIPVLTQSKTMRGMGQLTGFLQNEGVWGTFLAVAVGVILFVASSNAVTATAISREGEDILFSKYIPLSFQTQIMAKVISGVLMGLIGMLSMSIAAVLLLKIPLFLLILVWGISLLAILFSNLAGIMIDLLNPKLHWDNEQKAVKQNINLVLSMAFCVICCGLTVWAVVKLKLDLSQTAMFLVAVYGLWDVLLYRTLRIKGSELFRKIEY